jgi:hypothetical protein
MRGNPHWRIRCPAFDAHSPDAPPRSSSGEALTLDYAIDGVHVVKTVQPQTWQDEYIFFSGVYQGAAVLDSQAAACPPPTISPPLGLVAAFNVAPTFSAH